MPVEKRRFQDISIQILRQTGERAKFKDSNVPTKIVLHFRLVSAWKSYVSINIDASGSGTHS